MEQNSYLSVILSAGGEEGLKGVVSGDEETGEVDKELSSNVEEDEEEVNSNKAKDDINLGDVRLALKVGQDRVLRELQTKGCQSPYVAQELAASSYSGEV